MTADELDLPWWWPWWIMIGLAVTGMLLYLGIHK